MNIDENFLHINRIEQLDIQSIGPIAQCISGNLIGLVSSSNQIIIYNIVTKEKIEIPNADKDTTFITTIAINEEGTSFATADSDGKLTFWSLQTKTPIYSTKLEYPVEKMVFCVGLNTVVHSDSLGNVFTSTLNTIFIYKKTITTTKLFEFDAPLIALSICKKYILIAATSETKCLDSSEAFKVVFTDKTTTSCFGYYQMATIGRIIDQKLVLTDFEANNKTVIPIGHPVQAVSLISPKTYALLSSGKIDILFDSNIIEKDIPSGKFLISNNNIFVLGAQLHQIVIEQTKENFNQLFSEGKYESAFNLLNKKDDVKDIDIYLNQYIEKSEFKIQFLSQTLERLSYTEFITDLKFTSKRNEILLEFIKIHPNWEMNLNFIEEVSKITTDENILYKFLSEINYNASWVPYLIKICISKSMFDLAQKFAHTDIYLSLLIAEYAHDAMAMHEKLKFAMNNSELAVEAVRFLTNCNLSLFLAYDTVVASELLQLAFEKTEEYGLGIDGLVNNVIEYLKPENPLWPLIIKESIKSKVKITSIASVENFLVYGTDKSRQDLFSHILNCESSRDYPHLLELAIIVGYENIELDIIVLTKSLDYLFEYLFRHKKTTFIGDLHMVCKGMDIKQILITHWRELMAINPIEFAAEILNTHDESFIRRTISMLNSSYNFLKTMFSFEGVIEMSDQSTLLKYIEMLCSQNSNEVINFVKRIRNIEYDKVIAITEQKGILDATLHISGLFGDTKRIIKNSVSAITDELMEDPSNFTFTRQVIEFLSSSDPEQAPNMWYEIIKSFQLPFLKYGESFSENEALKMFIRSMTYNIPNILETSKVLTKIFSFLPFNQSKKIFRIFFDTIKEKNNFAISLNAITHEEAVKNQLKAVSSKKSGILYDASKCQICQHKLDGIIVCCPSCGSCYHVSCCHSWCGKCNIELCKTFPPDMPAIKKIQEFDNMEKKYRLKILQKKPSKPQVSYVHEPKIGIKVTRLDVSPEINNPTTHTK